MILQCESEEKILQSESEILIPNLIGVHHFEVRVMIISESVFDIYAWVVSGLMKLNATHRKWLNSQSYFHYSDMLYD